MNSMHHSINVKKAIYEDKSFVLKMVFLTFLILLLSAYLILQSLNIVHDLSIFDKKNFSTNTLSLKSFDNTFGELEELDLSKIELAQNSNFNHVETKTSLKVAKPIPQQRVVAEKKEKKRAIFIETQEVSSIKFLKSKFKTTNLPTYSIMISKRYFEQKKYKQALKWALITNELDSSNEDSWIIFAKSKVKLNQKEDAINALSEYLRTYDSQRAESILQQILKTS